MQRIFHTLLTLLLLCVGFTACSEEPEPDLDYDNWAARNDSYFQEVMSEAKAAVAAARATYGAEWEDHCDWRVYRSYLKTEHSQLDYTDSICVKIKERGEGPGCPLYTDSVLVNYIGRTMPTVSYPEGRIFDHSGVYNSPEEVFNSTFATPTALQVANTVEGFTTVLQHMHVGDRWMVYIPADLGYAGTSMTATLPPYSTLIFDLQLLRYARAGVGL